MERCVKGAKGGWGRIMEEGNMVKLKLFMWMRSRSGWYVARWEHRTRDCLHDTGAKMLTHTCIKGVAAAHCLVRNDLSREIIVYYISRCLSPHPAEQALHAVQSTAENLLLLAEADDKCLKSSAD